MKIVIQQDACGGSQSVKSWTGNYVHKGLINKVMFIKDGHPLDPEIESILDDNMDKTDNAEVSTIVGDFKIMDMPDVEDVSTIVGIKGVMSKLKFKINFSGCKGHLHACKMSRSVALEDILGWMILSREDIADIRYFLVGLVTGDNWQYDHGDNSHKKMTGDNWQIDHGDNSHKKCLESQVCHMSK
jgi:hypothetical protein